MICCVAPFLSLLDHVLHEASIIHVLFAITPLELQHQLGAGKRDRLALEGLDFNTSCSFLEVYTAGLGREIDEYVV